MTMHTNCLVCGQDDLQEIETFHSLPRVTSDCKPYPSGGRLLACENCGGIQKLPDATWFREINEIYAGYEIYKLSDGDEQLIFTDSGAVPRSLRLVEFLKKSADLRESGRLIDIGCGNGAALARYSRALPGWQLYGSELSDRALPELRSLPNFVDLHCVPTEDIPGKFELVSMIHSLEHMPSPGKTLEDVVRLLSEGGKLFVEVPDAETSPFDILVADHLSHFSRQTLAHLANRAGLSSIQISNSVLPKEITMLATAGNAKITAPVAQAGIDLAISTVQWLSKLLALARQLAKSDRFGIFGTSISGMWLFGALGEKVSFFVDEDPKRIGREHAGRPVLSPADAPAGATVFIPLAPAIAARVADRYADASARFVPSPPFSERTSTPSDSRSSV